jgi:chromosome partitioning protein
VKHPPEPPKTDYAAEIFDAMHEEEPAKELSTVTETTKAASNELSAEENQSDSDGDSTRGTLSATGTTGLPAPDADRESVSDVELASSSDRQTVPAVERSFEAGHIEPTPPDQDVHTEPLVAEPLDSEESAAGELATRAADTVSMNEPVMGASTVDSSVAGSRAAGPLVVDGSGEGAVVSAVESPRGSTIDSASPSLGDTPLARELSEITRRRQALAAATLPLPTTTRIFTIANQKGGVGKTTTTVNLAAALARNGARVLVIDLDPQGNASTALGIEHRSDTISVYDVVINDEPIRNVIQKSPEFEGLYCVPATIHLAGAEIELVSMVAREQRLRTSLESFLSESEEQYHYVFIDCPPSLGLLTINAFVAAREVLIPIQCEYYALEGLSQLLTNIQLIERHLNPVLSVSTILLTMYDARTNLANQVVQDVRAHFPDKVLSTLIPRSVRISEAPSYGQTVISYDTNSPGSLSYLEAAAEIAHRGAPE